MNNTSNKFNLSLSKTPNSPKTDFTDLLTNKSGNSIINIINLKQTPSSKSHNQIPLSHLKHSTTTDSSLSKQFIKPLKPSNSTSYISKSKHSKNKNSNFPNLNNDLTLKRSISTQDNLLFIIKSDSSKNKKDSFTQKKSFSSRRSHLFKSTSSDFYKTQSAFGRTIHVNDNKDTNNNKPIIQPNKLNDYNNHKTIFKPFQIAGTIYSELYKQKEKFFKQIKETPSPKLANFAHNPQGETINSVEKKYDSKSSNDIFNFTTSFLNRKIINEIPVTFPLCISHNSTYSSCSQKRRHEKIINLFMKLKTYLSKDPSNDFAIVKEFLQKNNITNPEYYEHNKIQNMLHFLNHPIQFNPKMSLQDAILTALNYQPSNEDLANMNIYQTTNNGECPNNSQLQIETIYDININTTLEQNNKDKCVKKKKKVHNAFDNVDNEKFCQKIKRVYHHNSLSDLIKGLEMEFGNIRKEKMQRYKGNNNTKWGKSVRPKPNDYINYNNYNSNNIQFNPNKIELNDLIYDTNIFVPNLCLSYDAFNGPLLNKIYEEKQKIESKINKQKHLNEINQRMYYNSILRNSEMEMKDIKRRNKLTEFIILERAKKKLELEEKKKMFNIDKNII